MTPARFEIGQKHKQESEAGSKASWNTPRSDSRPTMSYPSRMALAFALTSLMTVLVLVGVVSVVWGTVFSDYTRSNIVEIANSAAEKLATSYEENGSWTAGELRTVATSSLVSDDLGMQVVNKKGVIVYDDSWPSASATADVRENQATTDDTSGKRASHSPVSSAPTDSDSVANVEIVTSSGEHVGQVKLWAIGSDALLTKRTLRLGRRPLTPWPSPRLLQSAFRSLSDRSCRACSPSRFIASPVPQSKSVTATCRLARDCAVMTRSISWVRPSMRWPLRSRRI